MRNPWHDGGIPASGELSPEFGPVPLAASVMSYLAWWCFSTIFSKAPVTTISVGVVWGFGALCCWTLQLSGSDSLSHTSWGCSYCGSDSRFYSWMCWTSQPWEEPCGGGFYYELLVLFLNLVQTRAPLPLNMGSVWQDALRQKWSIKEVAGITGLLKHQK